MKRFLCSAAAFAVFCHGAACAESLWQRAETLGSSSCDLYSDKRARMIGDLVTIVISESASLSSKAETSTKRESTVGGSVTSFLYPSAKAITEEDSVNDGLKYTGSRFGMHKGTMPAWQWEGKNKFAGGGTMSNTDSFTGRITAVVKDVLPNGNLFIEGSRDVFLDKERQKILISGFVRQEDIAADNTVSSKFIADARIFYQGKGPIRESQNRGWLSKIWDKIGIL